VRDWLAVITRINPLTCAVDPLRHLVFALQDMPVAAAARFATGVSCSDTHCRLPWNWASPALSPQYSSRSRSPASGSPN